MKTSVIYFNTFSVWLSLKSLMSFSVALTCIHTWLSCIILSALGKALNSNALRTTSFKSVLCFTSRSLNAYMNCFFASISLRSTDQLLWLGMYDLSAYERLALTLAPQSIVFSPKIKFCLQFYLVCFVGANLCCNAVHSTS